MPVKLSDTLCSTISELVAVEPKTILQRRTRCSFSSSTFDNLTCCNITFITSSLPYRQQRLSVQVEKKQTAYKRIDVYIYQPAPAHGAQSTKTRNTSSVANVTEHSNRGKNSIKNHPLQELLSTQNDCNQHFSMSSGKTPEKNQLQAAFVCFISIPIKNRSSAVRSRTIGAFYDR